MARRDYQKIVGQRLHVALIIFFVVVSLLVGRLGYIQIVQPERYTSKALRQQQTDIVTPAKRGTIYDRYGKELAVSIQTTDVWVNKDYVKEESRAKLAEQAAPLVGKTPAEILSGFAGNRKSFFLIQKADDETVKKIKELGYSGLSYEESSKRYYPYGNLASFVIGHVSRFNTGSAGLENYFDKSLGGVPGRKLVARDSQGHEIVDDPVRLVDPENGYAIISTIDEVIQHIVEKTLEKNLVRTSALKINCIVMDPKTGEILAMSSKPDYNPNEPNKPQSLRWQEELDAAPNDEEKSKVLFQMWRNPMVNDIYEPGSVFKLVTAAQGLEEGKIHQWDGYLDKGSVTIAGQTLRNFTPKPFGYITFRTAFEQSVNTYFTHVGALLGADRFLDGIYNFGFGQLTGITLPGEQAGLVNSAKKMGPVGLATVSYGQGISVTPIQMASMISAFGNEGKVMVPRIVKEIRDDNGNIIQRFNPQVVKQAVSKETADEVLSLMEGVVTEGGGKKAAISGYRIGGKTGTAQKPVNGIYQQGKFISSFTAIGPVENPRLMVLVIIDEPKGGQIYGGAIATPIVKEIFMDTMRYMGIKPDAVVDNNQNLKKVEVPEVRNMSLQNAATVLGQKHLQYNVEGEPSSDQETVTDSFPLPGENVPEGSTVVLYFKGNAKAEELMPDLTGKTIAEVQEIANASGWQLNIVGTGLAVNQHPRPGSLVQQGALVNVQFQQQQQPPAPAVQPGNPAGQPASPAVQPGNPAGQPASPAAQPGNPIVKPGSPAAQPGNPIVKPGSPAAQQPGRNSPEVVTPAEAGGLVEP